MQIDKPQTEDELLTLRVVKQGKMPNDRELEERMRAAAHGKEKVNGVVRRPGDSYNP